MSIFVYLRHCAWARLDFVGFSAMVSRERILSAITFGIEVTMAEKKTSSKQKRLALKAQRQRKRAEVGAVAIRKRKSG
ncbi:hypothetical protein VX037_00675 [Gordonia sp. Z-3]|uniref:Uncharacterized protein n=2 Tax=Gordonia TaxID=2053 RepID=A0A9X3D3K4_9ACTN|nr:MULTISPECIES: hypothetical protein [Gordonia]MCF3940240.1 hypothetical protein [Gordonia tangerina]MCX2964428.1 hypothetical protein [Gordonia aquimaris]MED5799545.1 hypothetical protein [Gordonia sp. Z-3]